MRKLIITMLASVLTAVLVQGANAAGRPSCLVSNERTGLGTRSLQAGIDSAASGDTLAVKGTCVGPATISKNLQVRGVSNKPFGVATLDGGGLGSVVTVTGGVDAAISDLVITNGATTSGTGGGIFTTGTLTLTGSTVTGNTASNGGGISVNFGGSLTLNASTVSANNAFAGGGISSNNIADTITLNNSTVSGNTATALGGGILLGPGALTINHSTVAANHGPNGGGILVVGGTASLRASTVVSDNDGSGILIVGGSVTLADSTVRDNTATNGGGVLNSQGLLTLEGSAIITANTATLAGGGIFNNGGTLTNCISGVNVIGNIPDDIFP